MPTQTDKQRQFAFFFFWLFVFTFEIKSTNQIYQQDLQYLYEFSLDMKLTFVNNCICWVFFSINH